MTKRIKILQYVIITINILIYLTAIFTYNTSMEYLESLIFFMFLTLFIYTCGLAINKEDVYKNNINILYVLYFIMLLSLTMFIRRPDIELINKENLSNYLSSINLIPFKTIISYINNGLNTRITFYNIFGNLVALMPLSFLLMLKDDKNIDFLKQTKKLILTVLIIEIIQLTLNCGIFDIDDFILNVGGALLFYLLLSKTKFIYTLKKLFYTNFKLPNKVKYIPLTITTILEIVIIIYTIYELI